MEFLPDVPEGERDWGRVLEDRQLPVELGFQPYSNFTAQSLVSREKVLKDRGKTGQQNAGRDLLAYGGLIKPDLSLQHAFELLNLLCPVWGGFFELPHSFP